jgi:two-component system response regulator HupR/HoxA
MAREFVHIVVSDQRMPGTSGRRVPAPGARQWPDTVRLILSGYTDAEDIISGINDAGIWQYLLKPWHPDQLLLTLKSAADVWRCSRRTSACRSNCATARSSWCARSPAAASRPGRGPVSIAWSARRQPAERGLRCGAEDCRARTLGADHRRIGYRQGTAGARHPLRQRTRRAPFVVENCGACPIRCSKPNSSATRRVPSPAPTRTASACSSRPTAARCSSTKSATPRRPSRSSCCARCRRAKCARSAARVRCRWTCASSPPPTATSKPMSPAAASARIFTTASPASPSHAQPARTAAGHSADRRRPVQKVGAWLGDGAKGKPILGEGRQSPGRRFSEEMPAAYRWPGNVRELQNEMLRALALGEGNVLDAGLFSPRCASRPPITANRRRGGRRRRSRTDSRTS